jgi:uncharacterized protein YjlB
VSNDRSMAKPTIECHHFADDGLVPNNPELALIVYRGAFTWHDSDRSKAEKLIDAHFAKNGWSNSWVNGIFDYQHYHATAHEVLGIARGSAEVQFGGPGGPVLPVAAGDVVLIPAGVGHCRKSASSDLSVVGAYPGGMNYDTQRATPENHARSLAKIAAVPPPATDPVLGEDRSVIEHTH